MKRVYLLPFLAAVACVKPAAVAPEPLAHPHPELLYWCWPEDTLEANATVSPLCPDGTPSWYPQYGKPGEPIYLKADEFTEGTLQIAVRQWNLVLGGEYLVVLPPESDVKPDVMVWLALERRCRQQGENIWCVHGIAGMRRLDAETTDYHGTITIYIDGFTSVSVLSHEIGHVLGLRHDPDAPGTLMFPSVSRSGMPEPGDVALIKRLHSWD